jgi:hypothetical protein
VPGFSRDQFDGLKYVYQHHLGTCKRFAMKNMEVKLDVRLEQHVFIT